MSRKGVTAAVIAVAVLAAVGPTSAQSTSDSTGNGVNVRSSSDVNAPSTPPQGAASSESTVSGQASQPDTSVQSSTTTDAPSASPNTMTPDQESAKARGVSR
jgi:hypothetical protein